MDKISLHRYPFVYRSEADGDDWAEVQNYFTVLWRGIRLTKSENNKEKSEPKKEDAPPFNFWQDHSFRFLEMAFRRDKIERCENPDGYGKHTGECGDTIEIFLTINNGKIQHASFSADGCMNTVACSNTVIHMVEDHPIEEAWNVTAEHVVDFLETLPENEIHCAELAVGSLYKALADYQKKQRE